MVVAAKKNLLLLPPYQAAAWVLLLPFPDSTPQPGRALLAIRRRQQQLLNLSALSSNQS
ncbi:hypothetical protein GOZ96_04895 [Agrobacterium vitis]|uniref:hypothetical protein n=1 Tax=Agrobacterium vitis TaxID=373 RepID=UPI0012E7EC94|nr:hypothetical protein [Agrobacterium vitis]MUZ95927.1 hypothetical protein [Agrobacterium vitis]